MVDKCSSPTGTPKWQCFMLDFLKPLTLSVVGNDDKMLQNKFFVVCKCPGDRDTINCQMSGAPGLIVQQFPGVCLGGCSRLELTRTLRNNEPRRNLLVLTKRGV